MSFDDEFSLEDEALINSVLDENQDNYSSEKSINPKIEIPDGFGISIADVQALLAKYNETLVAKDDPILVQVTISNAFLSEYKKIQEKYQETLKDIYTEQVKDFLKEVKKGTDEVRQTLATVSVDGLHKIHLEQSTNLVKFRTHFLYLTAISCLSAFINLAVYMAR